MSEVTPTLERRFPPSATRRAGILSIAAAVPPRVVSNEPIAARLGIEPEWIVERTGIRERRVLGEGETLLDLAQSAAERALDAADTDAAELDQILVATTTHDRITPALAPMLAARLRSNAGATDVNAACTGFMAALTLACGQIESARAERILVVGAEQLSAFLDPDDRSTAALFGDGAGAVVVGGAAGAGVGPFVLGSDGSLSELITAERDEAVIRMQGHDTFREAVDRMSQASARGCGCCGRRARRDRLLRLPPGERADPCGLHAPPRPRPRPRWRDHLPLREHLCRLDPDHPLRRGRCRRDPKRRPGPSRSLRRRSHMGRHSRRMGGPR